MDKTRLQDLNEAVRRFLAWESILAEKETLDLSPHHVKQAETQRTSADAVVTARIPEAYIWLLVPVQNSPQGAAEWQAYRLSGSEALAVRASKKLRSEELLVALAGMRLRMELDRVPLWRGDHVLIKQLAEDFARYTYLPRIKDPAVLLEAIRDGLGLLLWHQESFAYADSFDDAAGRYRGQRTGHIVNVTGDNLTSLLVRPELAQKQLEAERTPLVPGPPKGRPEPIQPGPKLGLTPPEAPPGPTKPKRFYGTVILDTTRVGRAASRIADEVISHLAGLVGSSVKVTMDIEAAIPGGASEQVVRTVTENSRTLKFTSHGFEKDR